MVDRIWLLIKAPLSLMVPVLPIVVRRSFTVLTVLLLDGAAGAKASTERSGEEHHEESERHNHHQNIRKRQSWAVEAPDLNEKEDRRLEMVIVPGCACLFFCCCVVVLLFLSLIHI